MFIELLLLADDFGLVPMNHAFLARRVSPCVGKSREQILSMCSALADADLVRTYSSGSGALFAYIPRFNNSPRAKKPKWPMPPDIPAFKEIKDLAKKRIADAQQSHADAEQVQTNAPETETETETETKTEESRKRSKSGPVLIQTWLDAVNASGEEAIPASDPVFAYAEKARIPMDFISLAWGVFVRKQKQSGKRQKSWPQTFRNYVEGNWLKLWALSQDGDYFLTTVGKQEQMVEAEHA